jgi:type I restriction enzyme, R subunit
MSELHLQDKFLIPFFRDELGYQEVKANTITNSLIIEEDLQTFIATTELNQKAYEILLKKYSGNASKLLAELIELIQERIASSRNMALFINANKSVTLQGIKLHLFYTDDSVIHNSNLFDQNIFSVVQELPYKYKYQGKQIFSFRPDISLFVNGIYLGYSELKSNLTNQTARKNGRGKVIKDYFEAVKAYYEIFDRNPYFSDKEKDFHRKDFLKVFEKAIHITSTDIGETYIIRTLSDFFDEILITCREGKFDREEYTKKAIAAFKPYPLLNPEADKKDKLKELFTAHYSKSCMEKEILYYNFIERDEVVANGKINLQKFGSVREMLDDDTLQKLAQLRIVFLIDEIHRSNSGDQHEEMVNIFDELQTPFDMLVMSKKT